VRVQCRKRVCEREEDTSRVFVRVDVCVCVRVCVCVNVRACVCCVRKLERVKNVFVRQVLIRVIAPDKVCLSQSCEKKVPIQTTIFDCFVFSIKIILLYMIFILYIWVEIYKNS